MSSSVFSSSSGLLRSRSSKQLSLSCSDPLLLNSPRKLSSSLHSEASDASLLSSLLDESCVQENTLLDSCWGTTPPDTPVCVSLWCVLTVSSSAVPGLDHVDPKSQFTTS